MELAQKILKNIVELKGLYVQAEKEYNDARIKEAVRLVESGEVHKHVKDWWDTDTSYFLEEIEKGNNDAMETGDLWNVTYELILNTKEDKVFTSLYGIMKDEADDAEGLLRSITDE